MKSIFQHTMFRWMLPILITALAIVLTLHHSPDPIVLWRYNYNFFRLIASTFAFALVSWWISLNQSRYLRLQNRLAQLPVVSLAIVSLGLLALADLFIDLIGLIAIFPLFPACGLVLLTMPISYGAPGRFVTGPIFREAARICALVLVSLFAGLLMAEFLFRTLLLEPKVPATEQQFYNLIAASWPRDISVEKAAGTYRILGLSDSFGRVGDAENYHYLLETLWRASGYKSVEVINISAVDYGPFDTLEVLKRFGSRYQPDLVLHGFYIGNDFGVPDSHVMTYQNIGVRMPQGAVAYRPRNLFVVQWLRSFSKVQADKLRKTQEARSADAVPQGIMSHTGFLNIERRMLDNYRLTPAPAKRWAGTLKNLDAIRTEVNRLGATYILVMHPDQIQMDSGLKERLETRFDLNLAAGYNFELPQKFLADYCLENDLYCLNLLDTFSTARQPLFQANDIHYNQAGNELAALAIFEFLQQHQLIQE